MKKQLAALGLSTLLLAGCLGNDPELAGGLIGGAAGGLTAAAIGSSDEWIVLATLIGAAAGVLVARNSQTGECAYSDGAGGYYTAACPD